MLLDRFYPMHLNSALSPTELLPRKYALEGTSPTTNCAQSHGNVLRMQFYLVSQRPFTKQMDTINEQVSNVGLPF